MHSLIIPASIILGIIALLFGRNARWAYISSIVLGFIYFPARVGFNLQPSGCQTELSFDLALMSLRNFPHIVHFAWFFAVTAAQFSNKTPSTFIWSGLISLVMGGMVELAEGITGKGNCRVRDLIPDAVGAFCGAVVVLLWITLSKRLSGNWKT